MESYREYLIPFLKMWLAVGVVNVIIMVFTPIISRLFTGRELLDGGDIMFLVVGTPMFLFCGPWGAVTLFVMFYSKYQDYGFKGMWSRL